MDLLKQINDPAALRSLSRAELKTVADQLRTYLLESVSKTGGHLSSNLGTVELTIALHYVFNTPEDRIVWDVGHQTYPHKILTGRRDRMPTLRQWGGRRLLHALELIGYFLWELVVSALTVARAVVRPQMDLRPGIVAIPIKGKSPAAVMTLANLITMTPGTLSLYADERAQVLYVHSMNVTNPDEFRRTVQQSFARRVEEVMG